MVIRLADTSRQLKTLEPLEDTLAEQQVWTGLVSELNELCNAIQPLLTNPRKKLTDEQQRFLTMLRRAFGVISGSTNATLSSNSTHGCGKRIGTMLTTEQFEHLVRGLLRKTSAGQVAWRAGQEFTSENRYLGREFDIEFSILRFQSYFAPSNDVVYVLLTISDKQGAVVEQRRILMGAPVGNWW